MLIRKDSISAKKQSTGFGISMCASFYAHPLIIQCLTKRSRTGSCQVMVAVDSVVLQSSEYTSPPIFPTPLFMEDGSKDKGLQCKFRFIHCSELEEAELSLCETSSLHYEESSMFQDIQRNQPKSGLRSRHGYRKKGTIDRLDRFCLHVQTISPSVQPNSAKAIEFSGVGQESLHRED
ncbi:Uncharacterized protein Rs2_20494 [Raphanus sativus]|nr:Uncharacterized protein Rs2_20494 [Raphanus sativus]